jgi:hypothetical protein
MTLIQQIVADLFKALSASMTIRDNPSHLCHPRSIPD